MSLLTLTTNICIGKACCIDCNDKQYLLTAAHVIQRASVVKCNDIEVQIVYSSIEHDLALVSIPSGIYKSFAISNVDQIDTIGYDNDRVSLAASHLVIQPGDSGLPDLDESGTITALWVGNDSNTPSTGYKIPAIIIRKFLQQYQKLTSITIPKIPKMSNKSTTSNPIHKTLFCEI